jgi:hypothetical protein
MRNDNEIIPAAMVPTVTRFFTTIWLHLIEKRVASSVPEKSGEAHELVNRLPNRSDGCGQGRRPPACTARTLDGEPERRLSLRGTSIKSCIL